MDTAPKADLVKTAGSSLVERTRDLATMSEDELRRFAVEAARDRDAAGLWALTEARLTLHGSSGVTGLRPHPFSVSACAHGTARGLVRRKPLATGPQCRGVLGKKPRSPQAREE